VLQIELKCCSPALVEFIYWHVSMALLHPAFPSCFEHLCLVHKVVNIDSNSPYSYRYFQVSTAQFLRYLPLKHSQSKL
jgi:hypothetical protein